MSSRCGRRFQDPRLYRIYEMKNKGEDLHIYMSTPARLTTDMLKK